MKNDAPPPAIPDYLQMRELYFKKIEPLAADRLSIANIGEDIKEAAANGKVDVTYDQDQLNDWIGKLYFLFMGAGYNVSVYNHPYSNIHKTISIGWGKLF